MSTITDILSAIFIIALLILIVPQLFEILAFIFVIFLQIMVGYMVASFLFAAMRNLFSNEEEGQRAWAF